MFINENFVKVGDIDSNISHLNKCAHEHTDRYLPHLISLLLSFPGNDFKFLSCDGFLPSLFNLQNGMDNCRINTIRIDCTPEPKASDLCSGSCVNKFNLDKAGIIRSSEYTIKFTRNLFLNVYVKNNFKKTLNSLPDIIENIRLNFNQFKIVKVQRFKIRIVNIQASGSFPARIDFDKINTDLLRNFDVEVGRNIEPPVPVFFGEKIPMSLTYLTLITNETNKLKLYHNGYFTIIAKDCDAYITLKECLRKI